jgi:hypothetical protein
MRGVWDARSVGCAECGGRENGSVARLSVCRPRRPVDPGNRKPGRLFGSRAFAYCPSRARTWTLLIQNVANRIVEMTGAFPAVREGIR